MPGESYPLDGDAYPGDAAYVCDETHQRDCIGEQLLPRLRRFILEECGV